MALELEIIHLLLLLILNCRFPGGKTVNLLSESLLLGLSVTGRCVADHTTVWTQSQSLPH